MNEHKPSRPEHDPWRGYGEPRNLEEARIYARFLYGDGVIEGDPDAPKARGTLMAQAQVAVLTWWQKAPVLVGLIAFIISTAGSVSGMMLASQSYRLTTENRIHALEETGSKRDVRLKALEETVGEVRIMLGENATEHKHITHALDKIADKLGVIQ